METIKEAVLSKVKAEAQSIVEDAQQKAREEIERAKRQREARLAEERARMLAEAKEEASRILAQAAIRARQELSRAKADTISKIVEGARTELSRTPCEESELRKLIREAINALGADKGVIYVAPKDADMARNLIKTDGELSGRISEVREYNCLGGVIAEDTDGKLRIDNTYETRLETVLPKLLADISKKLFEAQ